MKILFLTSSMQGGGAERVAALLVNGWVGKGNNVVLMPTFSERGDSAYPLEPSVELTFLSDLCSPAAGRVERLMGLRKFIRTFQPDVVVSFLPHVNIAAILAAIGLKVPVIACERTYPPAVQPPISLVYRVLRRLVYQHASVLVGQTEATANWLRLRAGKRTSIATVPNPVVLPLPSKTPIIDPDQVIDPRQKLILWAGRIDDAKRGSLLIEAFKTIVASADDWDVCMLGSGPLHETLCKKVADLNLEDRIFLPGFAGNLADWYRRADVYVMTSSFEGFPNTLLEALAHGVPSVAFDVLTGPRDLSDQGRRLILLPDSNHVVRLADALSTLLNDPELRRRLSVDGSEVTVTYSEKAVFSLWEELFELVVDSSRSPEPKLRTARSE